MNVKIPNNKIKLQEKYDQLVKFLSNEMSVGIERISLDSRIAQDFGVDGDDGVELLDNYSKKFNVDLSQFNYDEYFGPEGSLTPFSFIRYLFANFCQSTKKNTKEIIVKDLLNGIDNGFLKSNSE